MAKTTKQKKFVLDTTDPRFERLCGHVEDCWQAIAGDAEEAVQSCEGRSITRDEAVELCLDANRLRMYPGGPAGAASDEYVTEIAKAGGFPALCDAVAANTDCLP